MQFSSDLNRRQVLQSGASSAILLAMPGSGLFAAPQAAAQSPVSLSPILSKVHAMINAAVDSLQLSSNRAFDGQADQFNRVVCSTASMLKSYSIPVSPENQALLNAIQRKTNSGFETLVYSNTKYSGCIAPISSPLSTSRADTKPVQAETPLKRSPMTAFERRMELLQILGIEHVGWAG